MHHEIERLRRKLREGRSGLFGRVRWDAPGRDLPAAHSDLIDGLLGEIYAVSCEAADREAARAPGSGLAVVATGGYGRRELHPFSDIDIAFIPSEEEDPWVEAAVHTAFRLVMDVFLSLREVHVGYAFRPVVEAGSWDVPTRTALLDLRPVCGAPELVAAMERRVRETLSPLDIMLESPPGGTPVGRERSLYEIEPNLKEGPGGLRELHRARWIFQLLLGVRGVDLERELAARGLLAPARLAEIRAAADWFWRARSWLHLAAGRRAEVLMTNYQDRIARELAGTAAQDWLARHLGHAETLHRFRETAALALLAGPRAVDGALLEEGVLSRRPGDTGPGAAVDLLRASQRYGIPVGVRELERLDASPAPAGEGEPSDGEIRAFMDILGEGRGVEPALRQLLRCGLLDRFLPGFSEVMRFVPPDPAHRYTVGEHSIRMVAHLGRLSAGEDPRGGWFADLLGRCAHFDLLCLAALLHDAGKLSPSGDHAEAGAVLAAGVARRLRLAPEKRKLLDLLVRHHLLLVRTARLHDLQSPHVIQMVAERVPDPEALGHLEVLTYVDTVAVGENNWTSMDFRDLEDLHRRMQEHYARAEAETREDGGTGDDKVVVRRKLEALQAKNEASVMKHCGTMPSGYVLNTPLEEIAFHLQLLERLEAETVVLDVYNRPGDDYSELTICAPDDPQPGMLARITGVLYGCGVDIHRARAFTMPRERPVLLDTLRVRSHRMQISESRARRIRSALVGVLAGGEDVEAFLTRSGKSPAGGAMIDAIDLRNDLSEEHTVVHIVAPDLQGLLYLMTRALSRCGLHIHSAKVATWNGRAENNFYVTAGAGPIPDAELDRWTGRLRAELAG